MEQKANFQALTALKGLFILVIALHNTLAVTPLFSGIPGTAFIILFGGSLGNSLFYMLSGFLLSSGYKSRIYDHSISFSDYLLRRLKKLYPMYLISNAAVLALEILQYGVSAINIERVIFTVLLVRSPYNSPTGFLCALFACYILFFAITNASRSSTQYLAYLTLGVIIGYWLIRTDPDLPFISSKNGLAYMNFFLGCILADVYPLLSVKLHRRLQPLFLVLLPLLFYLMLSYGVEIIAGDTKVAFSFAICPMVLYLALVKGPCSKILRCRCLVFLGKISSSVFFWHLVLYSVFCDLYALFTRGRSLQEPQYLLYFVLMLLWSAGCTMLENKYTRNRRGTLTFQV